MSKNLLNLDYPVNRELLLAEARQARAHAYGYTDHRMNGYVFQDWLMAKHTSTYIEQIMDDFEVVGSPRFYWLEPHSTIPMHVDNNTQCSINLILTPDPAPIKFEDGSFTYTQALLNTTVMHGVDNGASERIMLKISIFDETFEQLSARIKYRLTK